MAQLNVKHIIASLLVCITILSNSAAKADVPVMLSFDVEKKDDVVNLETLNITVPATYFFLGQIVEKNAEYIKNLSKNNTIGSHAYSHNSLTEMSKEEMEMELRLTKELLEKTTGQAPTWFRAPFLAYNNDVIDVLQKLGFRYDSSGDAKWMQPHALLEFPISAEYGTSNIASDYNIFVRDQWSDEKALQWFKDRYNARRDTGQPLMLLFHPAIIVEHKEVLWQFIEFVKAEGGSFITADQWVERLSQPAPKRMGFWLDFTRSKDMDASKILNDVRSVGATDVYVMTKDYEGYSFVSEKNPESKAFGEIITTLKKNGIKVHAWVPTLFDPHMAQLEPTMAMTSSDGKKSIDWLSPSDPNTGYYINDQIRYLLDTYDFDGINLDYVRYPGLEYDFSDANIQAFAKDAGLENVQASELMTKYYVIWTDWQAKQITNLVKTIRDDLDTAYGHRNIELSADLIADASVNYRSVEKFGQSYSQLAQYLDTIIPMTYFKENNKTVDWVSQVISSVRYAIGDKKSLLVGLASYQDPSSWQLTDREFQTSVELGMKGSDGVVFYDHAGLFQKTKPEENLSKENLAFVRKFFVKTAQPVSLKNILPANLNIDLIVPVGGLVLIILGCFISWRVIRKKQVHGQSLAATSETKVAASLSSINFADLEKKIQKDGHISPEVFNEISSALQAIGAQNISRFRRMRLLEIIKDGPKALNKVQQGIASFHNDLAGLRRIEEAGILGYLEVNNKSMVKITERGQQVLAQSMDDGYSADLINFIDSRLVENVIIRCAKCDENTLGHWFWKNYECSGCHNKSNVVDAADLMVKK